MDWIQSEQRVAETDEERANVSNLYQKATQDYLSVPLWVKRLDWEYTVLIDTEDFTKADVEKLRGNFEMKIFLNE